MTGTATHSFPIQAAVINGRQKYPPFSSALRHSMFSNRGHSSPSRALSDNRLDTNPTRRQARRRLRQRDDAHRQDRGVVASRTCPWGGLNATGLGGVESRLRTTAQVFAEPASAGARPHVTKTQPNNYPHASAASGSDPTTRRGLTLHRPPETRPGRVHRWGLGGWYHRSIM